jgi:quercetin dioxygenase-like cupin family protein
MKKRFAVVLLAGVVLLTTIGADGAGSTKAVTAPTPVLNVITDALPKSPSAEAYVLAVTIPPGGATVWHTHPTPLFVYVQSGTGTWEYRGGRPSETRHAGQAIMEPPNLVGRIANHGTTAVFIVAFQVTKPGEPRIHPVP